MTELSLAGMNPRAIAPAGGWLAGLADFAASVERARRAARLAERNLRLGERELEARGLTRDDLMREIRDVLCGER